MTHLKLNLLDNCHSFLKEALVKAIAAEIDLNQWKFAILFLVQSIELALKERLQREHFTLIYNDIDKRSHTVTIEKAYVRLKDIVKIDMNASDLNSLKTAIGWRNQIVHHEFSFSITELKSVFANLFGFLQAFHLNHLGSPLYDKIEDILWQRAIAIQDYAHELYQRANDQLEIEELSPAETWPCNMCGWDIFVVENGINKCYLCGYEESVIECEDCHELIYEENAKSFDSGNMKGIVSMTHICEDCYEDRIDNEREWYYSTNS